MNDPLQPFLNRQGFLILDGALATELEARGADLSGGLWSARLLEQDPDLIRSVHLDYLRAGADCIISASYQATIEGFLERGTTEARAIELLRRSVDLCREARELFMAEGEAARARLRPLVAASVGPYGAALADGSEYTGRYDLDELGLVEFHSQRFEILSNCGADLLACETIPSGIEARALRRLLSQRNDVRAWVSFSCRTEDRLADGTPLVEAVRTVEDLDQVLAVGINCTPPHLISSLIDQARSATDKSIVVYPNSGESWNSGQHCWAPGAGGPGLAEEAESWFRRGAKILGGCCRTGPSDIRALREALGTRIEPKLENRR